MSVLSTGGLAVLAADSGGGGFQAPGPEAFNLPPIFESVGWFTKPILMAAISVVLIAVFYLATSRKMAMVPGKGQFVGEFAYSFIRNNVAREMIGQQDFQKFVPYLVALFSFVLVNNIYGVVPFVNFPTNSHIGWPLALAAVSWVVYNAIGIGRHGFFGYLKNTCLPSGVPAWLYPLIIPMEFLSSIVIRPVTLMLRLFANLFAGHLVLMVFALGGTFMLVGSGNGLLAPVGVAAFGLGIAFHFLELLIMALQAYIFTVLTASYISGALAEEH